MCPRGEFRTSDVHTGGGGGGGGLYAAVLRVGDGRPAVAPVPRRGGATVHGAGAGEGERAREIERASERGPEGGGGGWGEGE